MLPKGVPPDREGVVELNTALMGDGAWARDAAQAIIEGRIHEVPA